MNGQIHTGHIIDHSCIALCDKNGREMGKERESMKGEEGEEE